jgi:protein kinase A
MTDTKVKKLKLNEYDLGQTLGTGKKWAYEGSFGRVRISKHKTSGKFTAIKILKKAEIIKLKQVDHILNEIKILTMIEHPFIVTNLSNN